MHGHFFLWALEKAFRINNFIGIIHTTLLTYQKSTVSFQGCTAIIFCIAPQAQCVRAYILQREWSFAFFPKSESAEDFALAKPILLCFKTTIDKVFQTDTILIKEITTRWFSALALICLQFRLTTQTSRTCFSIEPLARDALIVISNPIRQYQHDGGDK